MKTGLRSELAVALAVLKLSVAKNLLGVLLLVLALGLAAAPAYATTTLICGDNGSWGSYTIPVGFPNPTGIVTFSQYSYDGTYTNGIPPENVSLIPGQTILFTSNSTGGGTPSTTPAFLGGGYYELNHNGDWGLNGDNDPIRYAGINDITSTGYMKFTFDNPVRAVGAFMSYDPSQASPTKSMIITAFGASGNILGSYNISSDYPINSPDDGSGNNEGAFRGIVSTEAIYSFQVENLNGVLTDLRFANVPVPGSVWLLGSGLLGLLSLRRKFRK